MGLALRVPFLRSPIAHQAVQEKRSHARVPLSVPTQCEPRGGQPFPATSKDISIGGMFLECEATLDFNTEVVIVLRLPGAKQDSRLSGVVRWMKPGGFGVQFGAIGVLDTHLISQLMRG
jgi:hypothetical protein